jgi:phosphatidylserine/phosphatidylglycerophosphate/cardiolipin synthase-like enzyme
MDPARNGFFDLLRRADRHGRFEAFAPFAAPAVPIMIHSKVMVVDDRILRVGSANLNNRSFGLDTECDLAVEAAPHDLRRKAEIRLLLSRLLSEHVDCAAETFASELEKGGSLLRAIGALNPPLGRRLDPFPVRRPGPVDRIMTRTHLFDPFDGRDNWRLWKRLRRD